MGPVATTVMASFMGSLGTSLAGMPLLAAAAFMAWALVRILFRKKKEERFMRKKTRISGLLMAMLLGLGTLSGCGSEPAATGSSTPADVPVSEESEEASDSASGQEIDDVPVFSGSKDQRIFLLIFAPAHELHINGGIDLRLQFFVDFRKHLVIVHGAVSDKVHGQGHFLGDIGNVL